MLLSDQYRQDFRRMVLVNEEIKQVVRVSNAVNLAALNALFIARKAGEVALGFGVVSAELRKFSQQLEVVMHSLTQQVFGLLAAVSKHAREWRNYAMHLRASNGGRQSKENLATLLDRLGGHIGQSQQLIAARQDQLVTGIERARKLCNSGLAISRAAKIEAVYGQQMAGGLRHVAEEVEQAIGDIAATLKGLQQQLAGQTS